MATNQKQSKSNTGLIGAIAMVASVSTRVSAALIELNSENNKLDNELKLDNAECDNCFVIAEKLIASKGDLIEIQRYIYSHWTVYAGDGTVARSSLQEFQTQRGDQAKFFDKKFKNGRFSC